MADGVSLRNRVQIIDSHTAGEPTRVVIAGGPPLGEGSLQCQLELLRSRHDEFRRAVLLEPRGSEVLVGALLCPPQDPAAAVGVIFFNDVGYLGMCGHGSIGVIATLAYLGRIAPGGHRIETPVGAIAATLHPDGAVSITNVPSYRYRSAVAVDVPQYGTMHGDIAWGGNWFFLVADHKLSLRVDNRASLIKAADAVRQALMATGIRGEAGAVIDHIEFTGPAENPANSGRNFVLCPGAAFDRSPCGTGTSAKMACLYADNKLLPGQAWRQEGILGTVFEGSIHLAGDRVIPTIKGSAYITAESTLLFDDSDPFREGIAF
ncbi:MAG TPA: proline racemase family protein [Acidobacteriaceae bacterium]